MKLAIIQPSIFPVVSQLVLTDKSDAVIFYLGDTFSRKGTVHRGKIRNPNGHQWITIPIEKEEKTTPLNSTALSIDDNLIQSIWKPIELNYKNSVYFDFYREDIMHDLTEALKLPKLADAALYMNWAFIRYFEIKKEIEVCLDFNSLLTKLKTIEYYKSWKEQGSENYRKPIPNEQKIKVDYLPYRQHFAGFEFECCALDLLFEYGPEAFKVFEAAQVIQE